MFGLADIIALVWLYDNELQSAPRELTEKGKYRSLDQNLPVLFHSSTVDDKYDIIYSHWSLCDVGG